MKKVNKLIFLPMALAATLVAGMLIGRMVSSNVATAQLRQVNFEKLMAPDNKFSYVLSLIKGEYVDTVNVDSLVEKVMPELMGQLDPHSVYIPAKEMGQANETLDGEFDGIGVVFNMSTDTIIVLNVIANGPSQKAGVLPGDRIVLIDGDTVAGRKVPQSDVMSKLRGKRGTTVTVHIERNNIDDLVPIDIIRDKIPIKSIDVAFMLKPTVGFMKLSAFARNSYTEMIPALAQLREQGMKSLIFDLRGNSGGFLDQAIALANDFLPGGQLIVYTEDRAGKQLKQYSDGSGGSTDLELVVLIDEYSASSSEILAGAIQDNDRGTIIGRRSFGKGLVQSQIPLGDGSAVRLTVARYYTPTGRSIQKPYEMGEDGYAEDILNRYMHNEFFSADSIHFADSLKFVTPGGKVVYGGGGIMPDIFVPLDTMGVTSFYNEVWGRNILYKYTLEYSDKHRKALNEITTTEQLDAFLDADKSLLNDFVAYAERNGVKASWSDINKSKDIMLAQIRANVGRNTPLEDVGYYSNIYVIDEILLRALKELGEAE